MSRGIDSCKKDMERNGPQTVKCLSGTIWSLEHMIHKLKIDASYDVNKSEKKNEKRIDKCRNVYRGPNVVQKKSI